MSPEEIKVNFFVCIVKKKNYYKSKANQYLDHVI